MKSLATEIKKLEDEVAALRAGDALLAQVRALLMGPSQMEISNLASDTDMRVRDLTDLCADQRRTIDDLRAAHARLIDDLRAAHARLVESADLTSGILIKTQQDLVAAGRMEDAEVDQELPIIAHNLRCIVVGMLEDIEARPAPAKPDLERLDAMIADTQGLTWDHSPKDLAMFKRIRELVAGADSNPVDAEHIPPAASTVAEEGAADEAAPSNASTQPLEPDLVAWVLKHPNHDKHDAKAANHPCPVCGAAADEMCNFREAVHAFTASLRCHDARRALVGGPPLSANAKRAPNTAKDCPSCHSPAGASETHVLLLLENAINPALSKKARGAAKRHLDTASLSNVSDRVRIMVNRAKIGTLTLEEVQAIRAQPAQEGAAAP